MEKLPSVFRDVYWPVSSRSEGREWPYRFYVKLERLDVNVKNSLAGVTITPPSVNRNACAWEINRVIARWSLVPFAPLEGSLGKSIVEIDAEVFNVLSRRIPAEVEGLRVIQWNYELFEKYVRERGLVISDNVLKGIVAALSSGKHVILVGSPGVGKTSLVEALAESHGLVLVKRTATAEWTRVDLIGGPVFVGGEVRWRSGALLEAIARHFEAKEEGRNGALLLIDELNRANLDKAFGEFFTIFGSSDPRYWRIPDSVIYEIREYGGKVDKWAGRILVEWEKNGGLLSVPSDFRVIGTMNTYDRRYLFTLGYALLRRFAVIEVSNPSVEDIRRILMRETENCEEVVDKIIEFYNGVREYIDLGVALLIDMAKIAKNIYEDSRDLGRAVTCAVVSIAVPQFEGLSHEKLEKVGEFLRSFSSEAYGVFRRYYREVGS
ncbi:MAG: hypothetical protein DRJ43_04535 [Thermoprotei archaeon]|nr:MAG: hypothetical protein DRJ43_04535 [Thermoprotei archaeon]